MRLYIQCLVILSAFPSFSLLADSITMRDYNLLSRGMNEAEVLVRLGSPDHETVIYDDYHYVRSRTWYYIPAPDEISNRQWISEIRFDSRGKISHMERYKSWQ